MKIKVKEIKVGMTIQYRGHYQIEGNSYLSTLGGSIIKSSPIVRIKEVGGLTQDFKHLKNLEVITECGLTLDFSTRQSVLLVK
jgi:hypothetical protein